MYKTLNSIFLIKKLLIPANYLFNNATVINVLVISAGTFPSYEILLASLLERLPKLQKVNFTLIDPVKSKTDLFLKKYANINNKVSANIMIHNVTVKNFLMMKNDQYYDLIYFEHSDFRTFPVLLAKFFGLFTRTASLRESIPLLTKVMKKRTLIIASCISKNEHDQLKHLLKFSFDVTANSIYLSDKYLYGGPYSYGLFTIINNSFHPEISKKRATTIQDNDNRLFLSFIFSGSIIFLNVYHDISLKIVIFILTLCFFQLFFYRLGRHNIFLLAILFILFVYFVSC